LALAKLSLQLLWFTDLAFNNIQARFFSFQFCEAQKLADFAPEKEIPFQIALRKQIYPNFSQKKNLPGFHNRVELGRYFLSK
jgi:hypothetical protein